ncbi:MAG: hypothetical protein IJX14_04495 [Clostridia bacterium]|nr:hypothetical protein [Clostridia bacterium]
MEQTWNFVWNRLYDDRTGMFYNHRVGNEPDAATKYLPDADMIRLLIPNPGGYGTGMEDCMLNAGIMMDAVISRYEATGDETMREYAAKIYRGMELDATVSHQKGFLPRGVSPAGCGRRSCHRFPVSQLPCFRCGSGRTLPYGCVRRVRQTQHLRPHRTAGRLLADHGRP